MPRAPGGARRDRATALSPCRPGIPAGSQETMARLDDAPEAAGYFQEAAQPGRPALPAESRPQSSLPLPRAIAASKRSENILLPASPAGRGLRLVARHAKTAWQRFGLPRRQTAEPEPSPPSPRAAPIAPKNFARSR